MRAVTRLTLIFQLPTTTLCLSFQTTTTTTRIQVCQNKDCQKRFQKFSSSETLVQTFSDLLPPSNNAAVIVESAGCLGQCGQGPNVSISRSSDGRSEKIFGSVDDGMMASAILEVGGGIDSPDLLLIAVEAIGRSTRATSPEKKIKILTPAIISLLSEKSNSNSLDESTALAHALVLRADAYLEQTLLSLDSNTIHDAHADAQMAISINHLDGRAYRVLADAEEALGNVIGAMEAVSKWAEVNPSFGTKARNELARLASAGSCSVVS